MISVPSRIAIFHIRNTENYDALSICEPIAKTGSSRHSVTEQVGGRILSDIVCISRQKDSSKNVAAFAMQRYN